MIEKTRGAERRSVEAEGSVPLGAAQRARAIMALLFQGRRLFEGVEPAGEGDAIPDAELEPHLSKVTAAIAAKAPVTLILPAFPAKSANRRKTLGDLPDLGERLGLQRLQRLCDQIAEIHPAGARCTICSDGRVFSDLVGVTDGAVTAYRESLKAMIDALSLGGLSVFDLDNVYQNDDFTAVREELLVSYAEPLQTLRARTREESSARELFNGMHRYVFEDMYEREGGGRSRSACREAAKSVTYRVIQRSNAWTRLIAGRFPEAVRLSIHPQPRVSDKIGIYLASTANPWGTPWHNAVLQTRTGYRLTPRAEAEAAGAFLVYSEGRPSHFVDSALFRLEPSQEPLP